MEYLFCEDITKHTDIKFDCCSSCHEDHDLGYAQMGEDYSDWHNMDEGWMLTSCCTSPNLDDEQFKKLIEKQIEKNK